MQDGAVQMTSAEQIALYTSTIFEPDDIVEVRRLPSRRSTWHRASELAKVCNDLRVDNDDGEHIYIGANPRTHEGGTKAADVALARCLFVDFDGGATFEEARLRIANAGLPVPTLSVHSGHGVHCYWRLSRTMHDLADWTRIQKRLIRLLDSDKSIHDPPRIMRLPGFLNCKESPWVPCDIVHAALGSSFPDALLVSVDAPPSHRPSQAPSEDRPGDRYNRECDLPGLLKRHGWKLLRTDAKGQGYWQRPFKEGTEHSATLKDGQFYVFSSNAVPFEAGRSYDSYGCLAALEHGGDFRAAARTLQPRIEAVDDDIDISGILFQGSGELQQPRLPASVLDNLPGVLRTAVDWCLAGAIKPQPELSLAALLACFGCLLGQQVKDDYQTRTNVMLLGLAPSGSGKEHPRQAVKQILQQSDSWKYSGPERIASHAGVISSLAAHSCRLLQVDEIGRMMATMGNPKAAPHLYQIASVLMHLYTSSQGPWTGDAYADAAKVKVLNQPCLCVYGTSVPETFYTSITPENLTDGLMGRMIVLEASYGPRQRPRDEPVPAEIIEQIAWWKTLGGGGNLSSVNPQPRLVPKSPEALELHESYCDAVHDRHDGEDAVAQAIWTRAAEKAAKLALIHACCAARPGSDPAITSDSILWAKAVVNHSNRIIVYAAARQVAGGDFESNLKYVYNAFGHEINQRELHRRCRKLRGRELAEILDKLSMMGAITTAERRPDGACGGRPSRVIRKTGEGLGQV